MGITGTLSAILVCGLALLVGYDHYWLPQQADTAELDFARSSDGAGRAAALVTLVSLDPLFGVTSYENRAITLFYDLASWEEQASIYDPTHYEEAEDLVLLSRALYTTLADVDRSDETRPLLEKMSEALATFPDDTAAVSLRMEIDSWLKARLASHRSNWQQALNEYAAALAINEANPATHYERAWVYVQAGEYAAALQDLDRVMEIALSQPDASVEASVAPDNLTTLNPTPQTPSPPRLSSGTPFPIVTPVTITTPNLARTNTPLATQNGSEILLRVTFPMADTPSLTPGLPIATGTATAPLQLQFFTRAQRIAAIQNLINSRSELVNHLAGSTATVLPNLYEGELDEIPTHTPGPTVNVTATAGAVAATIIASWLEEDTDGDGLSTEREIKAETDPNNPDSDDDGLSDGDEILRTGTEPTSFDTDGDGLTDGNEVSQSCYNPLRADTDGDGLNDLVDTPYCHHDEYHPTPVPTPFPNFAFGGHIHDTANLTFAHDAGMTWIKKQVQYSPDADAVLIAQTLQEIKDEGFKVLVTVIGSKEGVMNGGRDYYQQYAEFVALLAGTVDAIEVWSEPNLTSSWPEAQISGSEYTALLGLTYQAIKAVNPAVMVISGALGPTGISFGECTTLGCDDYRFLSDMVASGAKQYMDCLGIKFDVGATPPNERADHPADDGSGHYSWYFWPMVELHWYTFNSPENIVNGNIMPLCFTSIGFLSADGLISLFEAGATDYLWAIATRESEQTSWLAEALALSRCSGKIQMFIVWNIDFSEYGPNPLAGYAIVRPGNICPACEVLRAVTLSSCG